MKKHSGFLSLAFILLFAVGSCKKDKESKPVSPFSGKYVLVSQTELNIGTKHLDTYTNTATPCLSYNQASFKDNGSWSSAYVGAEDCVVSRTIDGYTTIGTKGTSASGAWTQVGNKIKFTQPGDFVTYAELSTINGKAGLTFRDTSQYFISSSVWVKQ